MRFTHGHTKTRNGMHVDELRKLAPKLSTFLEHEHPLSVYSSDSFWNDLCTRFPETIDWVIESLRTKVGGDDHGGTDHFEKDRAVLFRTLDSLHRHASAQREYSGKLSDAINEEKRAAFL